MLPQSLDVYVAKGETALDSVFHLLVYKNEQLSRAIPLDVHDKDKV